MRVNQMACFENNLHNEKDTKSLFSLKKTIAEMMM